MTLTFVTNFVHHHQLPLADEFYKVLGSDYHYISCEEMPEWLVKGGYDPTLMRPYIIRTYDSESAMFEARKLINTSDVVIIGSAPIQWVYKRKRENKITFHFSERWLKKIDFKILHPLVLYYRWKHHFQFRNKNCYMLCASAFTASDVHKFGCYPQKCFKWGYMTKVEDFDSDFAQNNEIGISVFPMMWCSRFLDWKHPELPIQLAARLKTRGYKFKIDIFGSGEKFDETVSLAKKLDVLDVVCFRGNRPNEEILQEMRQHKVFLFTSDRGEGWGAVANEALSNGCVLVGGSEIGSVPYLVKDGVNGCIFKSKDINSLEEKVLLLIENPSMLKSMRKEGFKTMREVWSPANAARQFLELADCIKSGKLCEYKKKEGPASWA